MASPAERARKKGVVVLASGMFQFNKHTGAPAQQAAILFAPLGQPSRRLDWIVVNHDDDSGMA